MQKKNLKGTLQIFNPKGTYQILKVKSNVSKNEFKIICFGEK